MMSLYAGLFLVALSTLMYEILLTRIFSVTMWFHFAFVAISIAMFGMTVGAIYVYLNPRFFAAERVRRHLAASSLGMAVTVVLSFIIHLKVPFVTEISAGHLINMGITYAAISVPFVFSGIAVCLALTRFPSKVGRLYATDLAGASIGCVLVVLFLGVVDGPSAVLIAAALACLAAFFFSLQEGGRGIRRGAFFLAALLILAAVFNAVQSARQSPYLRLVWIKGSKEAPPEYEKWNSFSRITVSEDPNGPAAFGWGLSSTYAADEAPEERMLKIDAGAATPITAFDGDTTKLEHLKYDVTNIVHYLRPEADVLAIGTGGGRDVLSALVFDQKSVTGVEINKAILDAANRRYGDFSGHLDQHPKVRFVNDEARSYIARSREKFDVIQVSFIDTAAATAAGAYVFTENSLYTVEAWKIFLEHLKPGGILTFCRWYYLDLSGEVYRMVTLAASALKEMGIKNPRDHILVVRHHPKTEDLADAGVILVSPDPFTQKDLEALRAVCARLNFDPVLMQGRSSDETLEKLVSGSDWKDFLNKFPINIAPPTDDNPFFFSMVRPWQSFNTQLWRYKLVTFNMKSIFVLAGLLLIVSVLTFACIVFPLLLTAQKSSLGGSAPLFVYFAAIGLGFMLVEISQMQRLVLFLGHPVYGLSVVLFTLLLSCSLGSFSVPSIDGAVLQRQGIWRLGLLFLALLFFGLLTQTVTRSFQSATTPLRILAAIGTLAPLGFFMGMAFPLGMRAAGKSPALTPWLWGTNGAASVLASVLAVAIALGAGISASFWTGTVCYGAAIVSFAMLAHARSCHAS